ncbi:MAG: gamma-glutamyl-gamma-aminobutyrate hydrolase family protein [Chloroflexi bacterium]|nr:gamma-glutamyl-gamma-aminobutyrate hydrolase family protein [Chloroflexota bacterium]
MTTSSPLPRIGVTRSRSDPRDPSIFGNYAACVERAGGQVVWLRPGDGQAPEAILDSLEALLLTGGADVDPACYGEPSLTCPSPASPARVPQSPAPPIPGEPTH